MSYMVAQANRRGSNGEARSVEQSSRRDDQRLLPSDLYVVRGLQRHGNRSGQQLTFPAMGTLPWVGTVGPSGYSTCQFVSAPWKASEAWVLNIIANLCLYASFMIFESVAFAGAPVSHRAEWEVGGIWLMLFLVAVLAARFLETKTQTRDS